MSQRDNAPLPEPQGLLVSERPSRGRYASEECLESDGWTKAAIARFLPAVPDLIGPFPFGKAGEPPVKYWSRRRVSQVRATKDFREWRRRAAIKRARDLKDESAEELKRWRAALAAAASDALRLH